MKFLSLIWARLWRRPGRTILIVLQVAVTFVLFGVLHRMKTGVEAAIGKTRADLLLYSPIRLERATALGVPGQLANAPGRERDEIRGRAARHYQKTGPAYVRPCACDGLPFYTAKWIPGLSMPVVVIAVGVLLACLVANAQRDTAGPSGDQVP